VYLELQVASLVYLEQVVESLELQAVSVLTKHAVSYSNNQIPKLDLDIINSETSVTPQDPIVWMALVASYVSIHFLLDLRMEDLFVIVSWVVYQEELLDPLELPKLLKLLEPLKLLKPLEPPEPLELLEPPVKLQEA